MREIVAEAREPRARGAMRSTLVARARQLAGRTAELRAAFGQQPVSQADLADRPGRPGRFGR